MMPPFPVLTFIGAVALALIHVAAGAVVGLRDRLRGRWLSLAGGVSVTYVFIHIHPLWGRRPPLPRREQRRTV